MAFTEESWSKRGNKRPKVKSHFYNVPQEIPTPKVSETSTDPCEVGLPEDVSEEVNKLKILQSVNSLRTQYINSIVIGHTSSQNET